MPIIAPTNPDITPDTAPAHAATFTVSLKSFTACHPINPNAAIVKTSPGIGENIDV